MVWNLPVGAASQTLHGCGKFINFDFVIGEKGDIDVIKGVFKNEDSFFFIFFNGVWYGIGIDLLLIDDDPKEGLGDLLDFNLFWLIFVGNNFFDHKSDIFIFFILFLSLLFINVKSFVSSSNGIQRKQLSSHKHIRFKKLCVSEIIFCFECWLNQRI